MFIDEFGTVLSFDPYELTKQAYVEKNSCQKCRPYVISTPIKLGVVVSLPFNFMLLRTENCVYLTKQKSYLSRNDIAIQSSIVPYCITS